MRIVTMPSPASLVRAVWLVAGVLLAAAYVIPEPDRRTLLLAIAIGLLVLSNVLSWHEARRSAARMESMRRNIEMLETAEGLGGFGRWCIECKTRSHFWSEEMARLVGMPDCLDPGEALLRKLIPQGFEQVELVLQSHISNREPYALEFEVTPPEQNSRILRASVQNVFGDAGARERVFMVVHDVTATYTIRRDRDEALSEAAKARREADTDVLTGLANRRFTMAQLDKAVINARVRDEALSIVVFDIDCFKQVNDSHGHPAGDKVIKAIARIAERQGRLTDSVGRIGGEEFLWIMPGCDAQAALQAAERLRWAVEAGTHSAPIPSVTISAGHAQMGPAEAPLLLFARADEALYEAKRSGRNRVAIAA